ncbi:MAG: uroporphyrinogen-III synthase [candidate division WOR-3 bacterium]
MNSLNEIFILHVKTDSFVLFSEIWNFISKFEEIYFDRKSPYGILWAGKDSEWIRFEDIKFKENEKSKLFLLGERKNKENLKEFLKKKKINFREIYMEYNLPDGILKKRIFCITRPLPDALEFSYKIESLGAKSIPLPLLKFKKINLDIKDLKEDFDYIIFTSKRGIYALKENFSLKETFEILKNKKIISIGPETAKEIEKIGFSSIVPDEYTQEGILKIFEKLENKNKRVLILRTEGRKILKENLEKMGFYVKEMKIYEMVKEEKKKIDIFLPLLKKVTDFVFTSPRLFEIFLEIGENFLKNKRIITIGKITGSFIENKGFKVYLTPKKFITDEIIKDLIKKEGKNEGVSIFKTQEEKNK